MSDRPGDYYRAVYTAFTRHPRPALRFPPDIETEFNQMYADRYQLHIQIAGLLGLLALIAPTPWDYWMGFAGASAAWHIRIVASVFLMTCLAYSTQESSKKLQQPLITLNAAVCYFATLLVSEQFVPPISDYYAIGSTLVLISAFVISGLQFSWGKRAAILMSGLLGLHLWRLHASLELFTIQVFVMVLGSVFSLSGTYLMELSLRQNFLQSRLLALEHKTLEDTRLHLEILTSTDGLTRIANRRAFDENLQQEWMRQQRSETPLTLLMLDIDHFKQFNDHYGHPQGDACLQRIALTLADFARRPGDLAARYGGEEFVLLFPDTPLAHALPIGQKILEAISALEIPHALSSWGKVTASMGIASMIPQAALGAEQLILRADEALYQAKASGRNTLKQYLITAPRLKP